MNKIKYTFHIYKNGTVYNVNTKQVICTAEGRVCVDRWIKANTYTEVSYIISGTTYIYWIYPDGKVVDP